MFFALPNDRWAFAIGTGTTRKTLAGPPVELGLWVRLTGSYDATSKMQRFWVDTKLQKEMSTDFVQNLRCPLRLGAGASERESPWHWFHGKVKDLHIYDSAL